MSRSLVETLRLWLTLIVGIAAACIAVAGAMAYVTRGPLAPLLLATGTGGAVLFALAAVLLVRGR